MNLRIAIALVIPLSLLTGIAACQQPLKGDRPARSSSEGGTEWGSEPGWTVSWSQIKAGMDAVEVLSLLGEPKHVKVTKISTTWYYSDRRGEGPHVVFDTRRMRIERWRPPERR